MSQECVDNTRVNKISWLIAINKCGIVVGYCLANIGFTIVDDIGMLCCFYCIFTLWAGYTRKIWIVLCRFDNNICKKKKVQLVVLGKSRGGKQPLRSPFSFAPGHETRFFFFFLGNRDKNVELLYVLLANIGFYHFRQCCVAYIFVAPRLYT